MNDGKKKKPQKHQNRTAFKINFDTQALQTQKKVSLNNLCVRCTDVMQWKLQYNKYKKMTEPGRCNFCHDKNVFRSYMRACQPCIQLNKVCAKCLQSDYQEPEQVKVLQKDQKKQQKKLYQSQIQFMKTLQQRSRRTVRRQLQKGVITWDAKQQYFVDEQGKKMIGLHFRKCFQTGEDGSRQDIGEESNDDQGDMFGIQDDGQQETEVNQDGKNQQQKPEKEKKKKQQNQQIDSDVQGDQIDFDEQQNEQDDDYQDDEDQNQNNQEEYKQKYKKK